ncbi:hypothetical protein J6590_008813 [Homalodisca vitripennis]|nr:hypothetical protein J6590_008813 [Homalodisca vitripennis]
MSIHPTGRKQDKHLYLAVALIHPLLQGLHPGARARARPPVFVPPRAALSSMSPTIDEVCSLQNDHLTVSTPTALGIEWRFILPSRPIWGTFIVCDGLNTRDDVIYKGGIGSWTFCIKATISADSSDKLCQVSASSPILVALPDKIIWVGCEIYSKEPSLFIVDQTELPPGLSTNIDLLVTLTPVISYRSPSERSGWGRRIDLTDQGVALRRDHQQTDDNGEGVWSSPPRLHYDTLLPASLIKSFTLLSALIRHQTRSPYLWKRPTAFCRPRLKICRHFTIIIFFNWSLKAKNISSERSQRRNHKSPKPIAVARIELWSRHITQDPSISGRTATGESNSSVGVAKSNFMPGDDRVRDGSQLSDVGPAASQHHLIVDCYICRRQTDDVAVRFVIGGSALRTLPHRTYYFSGQFPSIDMKIITVLALASLFYDSAR